MSQEFTIGELVHVKRIDGSKDLAVVYKLPEVPLSGFPAHFMDADDATLADFWRGIPGIKPDDEVVTVKYIQSNPNYKTESSGLRLGNKEYDFPKSRVFKVV